MAASDCEPSKVLWDYSRAGRYKERKASSSPPKPSFYGHRRRQRFVVICGASILFSLRFALVVRASECKEMDWFWSKRKTTPANEYEISPTPSVVVPKAHENNILRIIELRDGSFVTCSDDRPSNGGLEWVNTLFLLLVIVLRSSTW